MIKAIIFDMDGVIIDSEPYYQKVLLHILRHFGIQATSNDLLALAGGSSTHFNEIINPLIQGIISRKDFDLYHSQYYSKHNIPYMEIIFPYVKDLLQWLKDHGYRIAIASSSKQDEILNVLNVCQIREYFEIIMSGDMFKESKPHPEIYVTCVEKLKLKPHECMAIEDSEYGITAAKKAGLTCIAKTDKRFGYNQEMADYHINNLIEIIKILEEMK